VSNYRNLGYRIALENIDSGDSSLERTRRLKPDIVKLPGALIHVATQSLRAAESLKQRVKSLHRARIQVALTGIETKAQLEIARKSRADLLQGFLLAKPEYAASTQRQHGRDEPLAA
jgi:EAL domain-containing protein (putative c-di-GMP-specific phosphodiesterase class I)